MENIISSISTSLTCPVCHQPVTLDFYFCPNCGKNLKEKPLSTTVLTQLWIYALSIILPMILFTTIRYWPAVKYMKSDNQKAKRIGITAVILTTLSTIFVIWMTYITTKQFAQSLNTSIGGISQGLGGL